MKVTSVINSLKELTVIGRNARVSIFSESNDRFQQLEFS
jgi:ribosomal protein L36